MRQPARALQACAVLQTSVMKRLLALSVVAIMTAGCAAPSEEDGEEDFESTESSIVSAGGGACPTDARLSQGFKGRGHDGVDLANARGTPIFAVAAGVVTASGPASGYGQWIRIKHDDGSMTEYGHMFQRDVQVGARVQAGQRIALMGSEGQSTGPHLHLRTYANAAKTGAGNGMNPIDYLRAKGVAIPCKPSGAKPPPAPPIDTGEPDGDVSVDVWKATDLRATPTNAGAVVGTAPRASHTAICWTTGDVVVSDGYTNDRWVKLEVNGTEGFVSGIFLKGDQTGGVTEKCP